MRPAAILAGTILSALMIWGCGSNGGGGTDASAGVDAPDVVDASSADIVTIDTTGDAGQLDPGQADQGPTVQPTSLLKGPWLQWVESAGFHVMAESKDEVPLKMEVTVGGDPRAVVWSTPFLPGAVAIGLPAPVLDGWLHEVEVTGVKPGESFDIEVVNTGDVASGYVPEAGKPLKMVVFGDNRTQDDKHQMVADAIMKYGPAIVVNSGDLTAVGGDMDLWTKFFEIEAPLLSSAFLYPIFGNHEAFLGHAYFAGFFHTENNYLNEGNWYSVVGDVGILGINGHEPSDWSDPDALAWLDAGLAKLRKEAAWVFVTVHEPLYTFSSHDPWVKGRDTVQPLFEKHHVDMVFSGHNHCYEHFVVNGIDYIVTGGGGAPLYGIGEGPPAEKDLRVAAKSFYHFMRLDVTADKLDVSVVDATTEDVFENWSVSR